MQSEPISTLGLELLADYYTDCPTGGIVTIKDVPAEDRTAVVLDSERRQLDGIQDHPWQFDTSDGEWFDCAGTDDFFHPRKTSRQVIHTLVDVVSKNGCLLLNVPQRADGTLDDHARTLLAEVGAWLDVCGEGIYDTVPWRRFGEGRTGLGGTQGYEGYNEADRDYGADDLRFTSRDDQLYATLLGWPADRRAVITSLGTDQAPADRDPTQVTLLGHGPVPWRREPAALIIDLPPDPPTSSAPMIKISTDLNRPRTTTGGQMPTTPDDPILTLPEPVEGPVELRTLAMVDPLGIGDPRPPFGWRCPPPGRR